MRFEWDVAKNHSNHAKHGISFELASRVFDDPLAVYVFDRIVDGEERWHAVGKIGSLPVLVVVHTYREQAGDEVIRIISARQASSHERRQYEEA